MFSRAPRLHLSLAEGAITNTVQRITIKQQSRLVLFSKVTSRESEVDAHPRAGLLISSLILFLSATQMLPAQQSRA